MAWERGYYYRVGRVRGRVVREYVGGGLIGQLAAERDAELRAESMARRAAVRLEKAEIADVAAQIKAICEQTDLAVRAALAAAGYRQHKRGEWRKRRV